MVCRRGCAGIDSVNAYNEKIKMTPEIMETSKQTIGFYGLRTADIITLGAIIIGLFLQYLAFSNRMSKFEGYTRAKIESMENDINNLWAWYKGNLHEYQKNKKNSAGS